MHTASEVTRTQAWWIAARPHTLPAALAPVIVGTALAIHDAVFALLPALAALAGAALIQIGTNFANDYYDAAKGADTDDRVGFPRATQAGLLPPASVKRGMLIAFALALLTGTYLVAIGGLPILVIGLASILSGYLYTAGPYPYGYYGLGDLFVFVFFGIIAVTGTYYVQAVATAGLLFPLTLPPGSVTTASIIASLPMAALITNILVVNNIRDIHTDRAAGKHTLAVHIGPTGSRLQFLGLLALAYAVPAWFLIAGFSPAVLLPLLTLPYAIRITRTLLREPPGEPLNPTLTRTGRLALAYAALFALGLLL